MCSQLRPGERRPGQNDEYDERRMAEISDSVSFLNIFSKISNLQLAGATKTAPCASFAFLAWRNVDQKPGTVTTWRTTCSTWTTVVQMRAKKFSMAISGRFLRSMGRLFFRFGAKRQRSWASDCFKKSCRTWGLKFCRVSIVSLF